MLAFSFEVVQDILYDLVFSWDWSRRGRFRLRNRFGFFMRKPLESRL